VVSSINRAFVGPTIISPEKKNSQTHSSQNLTWHWHLGISFFFNK
jgi:hypothetical protein